MDVGPDYKPPLGGKCCCKAPPCKRSVLGCLSERGCIRLKILAPAAPATFFLRGDGCCHSEMALRSCHGVLAAAGGIWTKHHPLHLHFSLDKRILFPAQF